jgi:hypothetical protein
MDIERYAFASVNDSNGRMRVLTVLRAGLFMEFRLWEANDDGTYKEFLSLETEGSPEKYLCVTISSHDAIILDGRTDIQPIRSLIAQTMSMFAARLPPHIANLDTLIAAQVIAMKGMLLGESETTLMCTPEEFLSLETEEFFKE